jgi:hypothetical protein
MENISATTQTDNMIQRGLEVFGQASKRVSSPRAIPLLQQLEQQLKQKAQPAVITKPPGE